MFTNLKTVTITSPNLEVLATRGLVERTSMVTVVISATGTAQEVALEAALAPAPVVAPASVLAESVLVATAVQVVIATLRAWKMLAAVDKLSCNALGVPPHQLAHMTHLQHLWEGTRQAALSCSKSLATCFQCMLTLKGSLHMTSRVSGLIGGFLM